MGSLAVPAGGLVYVDANAFIYSVEKVPDYWPILQPLWDALEARTIQVVSSELLILESLVKPIEEGDTKLQDFYEQIFGSGEIELRPITSALLRRAAILRAEHRLKTPDAIHAATAIEAMCTPFVTNDEEFRRLAELPHVILRDVLGSP